MNNIRMRLAAFATILLTSAVSPSLATAATATAVQALFNPAKPTYATLGQQFPIPSDLLTTADSTQLTGLRVNLPLPSQKTNPSDLIDVQNVINTLDGANIAPRISVPFSGAIDPKSVSSSDVFFVSMGSVVTGKGAGTVVGINQITWYPATNTLHAYSDMQLEQDTRYVLVVTNSIKDTKENSVQGTSFQTFLATKQSSSGLESYRQELSAGVAEAVSAAAVSQSNIISAAVFTTESVTALMEQIRSQVESAPTPAPANFLLGPNGSSTVFLLSNIAGILWYVDGGNYNNLLSYGVSTVALSFVPNSISEVAFGSFQAPNYLNAQSYIPPVPTLTGQPAVQSTTTIHFVLFVPAGTAPANGWPVAIYGHGFGDSIQGGPYRVALTMAANGIATIAMEIMGNGYGPHSFITVTPAKGKAVMVPSGGRAIKFEDPILSSDGILARGPGELFGLAHTTIQTASDLMQLVRVMQQGVDITGNGTSIVDASRIYYFGQSLGGIDGVVLMGTEPAIRAGVINVAGGPFMETARLSLGTIRPFFSADFRDSIVGALLAGRKPPLNNLGAPKFNENIPLRDQPPLVNTVKGSDAIQQFIDALEWAGVAGDPVAWAPYVDKVPLGGGQPRPVIVQFALGDQVIPSPTTSALVRAGGLEGATTVYRLDLAYAKDKKTPPIGDLFLTSILAQDSSTSSNNDALAIAVAAAAQQQIAQLFASDGATVIDPDSLTGAVYKPLFEGLFEASIPLPLPVDCKYLPPIKPATCPGQ